MPSIASQDLVDAGLAAQATAERVAPALDAACQKYGVDTGKRVASFLAQCSYESAGFRVTAENLNYSAQALLSVFPKFFSAAEAAAYARCPERIADRIYANRTGNGPEVSGDGWKFRGRGFIQLTGRDNYAAFMKDSGHDVLTDPEVVSAPGLAAETAAWFWKTNGLNELADRDDILGMTRKVNGGLLGLAQRWALWRRALSVFCAPPASV